MATWSGSKTSRLPGRASTWTRFSMAPSQSFLFRQKGTHHDDRIGGPNRSAAGPLAFNGRLHRVLRGMDDLRDHRHPNSKEPRSFRHPTGLAGWHADPDGLTDPADSRDLVRPVRWAA